MEVGFGSSSAGNYYLFVFGVVFDFSNVVTNSSGVLSPSISTKSRSALSKADLIVEADPRGEIVKFLNGSLGPVTRLKLNAARWIHLILKVSQFAANGIAIVITIDLQPNNIFIAIAINITCGKGVTAISSGKGSAVKSWEIKGVTAISLFKQNGGQRVIGFR